jgi:UDP-N-acetylmuramoyl-tripeptide--D-alanyl-D-alanine ligase
MDFGQVGLNSLGVLIVNIIIINLIMAYKFLQIIQQKNYNITEVGKMYKNQPRKMIPLYLVTLSLISILIVLIINFVIGLSSSDKYNLLILNVVFGILNFIIGYMYINLQMKTTKKPLVVTSRVKRLSATYIILLFLLFFIFKNVYVLIITIPFSSVIWFLSLIINKYIEEFIMLKYKNEARQAIYDMRNTFSGNVIGITGSYGKTTTKNIMQEIISSKYLSYMTPESYNTPGGISMCVREDLSKLHEVFICEMGAKYKGDIAEITKFVKPNIGVVTSIGPQHLDTFGNKISNIIETKMSLIETLEPNGIAILNTDNDYIAGYQIKRDDLKVIRYGKNESVDYRISNVIFIPNEGLLSFELSYQSQVYKFKTSLLGEHNIYNIVASVIVYNELNGSIDNKIIRVIENLSQIPHRQELKRLDDFNIIDDAFNANPIGMKSALDTLKLMPGNKFIITPGMIELGIDEKDIHFQLGTQIAQSCDYAILVGPKQTKNIISGLESTSFDNNKVFVVNSFDEGYQIFIDNKKKGDTLLIANDLTDVSMG